MIFLNYIKFKHGKLKRGERCLYRGKSATYLGTYVERGHVVDMMLTSCSYEMHGLINIDQFIEQCTDRSAIVCIAQQELPIEGQMVLC